MKDSERCLNHLQERQNFWEVAAEHWTDMVVLNRNLDF